MTTMLTIKILFTINSLEKKKSIFLKTYFLIDQHHYSLLRSAFSILVISPLGKRFFCL